MENISKGSIERISEDGIDVIIVKENTRKEISLNSVLDENRKFGDSIRKAAGSLKELDAEILSLNIFGNVGSFRDCSRTIGEYFKESNFPVTYIDGMNCFTGGIAGYNIQAISGIKLTDIIIDNKVAGCSYSDNYANYCILGNIQTNDTDKPRDQQTLHTLSAIEKALKKAGMNMTDLIRTWFYNDKILEWYDDFNYVRTRYYGDRDIFKKLLPASTGIGGSNPADAALVAGAVAIKKKSDEIEFEMLPSPLQCKAYDYGSSFSRAVEVKLKDHRKIFVSGTASIDPDGATAHVGDIGSQIELTLKVVDAILQSRGADMSMTSRANAYFRNTGDAKLLIKYINDYDLPLNTVIISKNDVCRDDLLFEIELDAVLLNK